ncbi:MAG: deacylase, partial [Candidatus Omnitrophica bacterium]|nr:deacylase [Candidatus Omnitrophota bacterium]
MPIQKLRNYLDKNKVRYSVVDHLTTYTAQGTAQSAHIPGK